jgi:hypothetical protein
MMYLIRLLESPSRYPGRTATSSVPAIEIAPVMALLRSGDSALGIRYRDCESGELLHEITVTPSPHGVAVLEGGAGPEVEAQIVTRIRRRGGLIEFHCAGCGGTSRALYLRSSSPEGVLTRPGPRCRACAGLARGPDWPIGAYARAMLVEWLKEQSHTAGAARS